MEVNEENDSQVHDDRIPLANTTRSTVPTGFDSARFFRAIRQYMKPVRRDAIRYETMQNGLGSLFQKLGLCKGGYKGGYGVEFKSGLKSKINLFDSTSYFFLLIEISSSSEILVIITT